jgi:hypothetical protein
MTRAIAVLLALPAGCGGRPAVEVPGGDEPAASGPMEFAVPDQAFEEDGFELEISRSYGKEHEALLIREAEAAHPARQDVIALAGDAAAQERAGIGPGDDPWWYMTFDGVRIPYAITDDAVVYYTGALEAFRHGDFSPSLGIEMKKAKLAYRASVSLEESYEREGRTFTGVYVVRMSLEWSQFCGPECAMGFAKERVVVLDGDGDVLAVFGDGETPHIVS